MTAARVEPELATAPDLRVDKLLHWRVVQTRTARGIERARLATPDSGFWRLWRERKRELRAAGIRVRKNPHSGRYVVYLYELAAPPPHWTDAA